MPFHENRLTFGQTMTESDRVQRNAARVGGPQPFGQGPGFNQESGLAQLNENEGRMLQRVVARLKRQRTAPESVGSVLGRGFGI